MAVVLTYGGEDWTVQRLAGSGSLSTNNGSHIGSGTGTATASKSDTALGTEVGSRSATTVSVTGSGSSAKYQAVATITYGASYAITEAGLFTASTGGTLLIRADFPAINVVSGDSIQFTFTLDPS